MRFLHIQNTDKFTEPYIKFINKNFNFSDHLFLVITKIRNFKFENHHGNVVFILSKNVKDLLNVVRKMNLSDKIILHGLSINWIVLLLFLQPWLLKKSYWVVWGGDLYRYLDDKKNIKMKIYEYIRKFVIKNMGGFITHIEGDYELARNWYKAKGKYYYSFLYPSNLFKDFEAIKDVYDEKQKYILIGNSANPSNNHIEIFDKMSKIDIKGYAIVCPLSYGDKDYARKIVIRGKEQFGDNFISLTSFVPYNEYLDILSNVSVAIFNHKRQQAVGNITSLLSFGKKVYIRDDITTWNFCEEHGLKVYSLNNDFQRLLEPMSKNIKVKNIEKAKTHFSVEKLIEDWKTIFNSKI